MFRFSDGLPFFQRPNNRRKPKTACVQSDTLPQRPNSTVSNLPQDVSPQGDARVLCR
ncbi:Sui1 family protein [Neisseria bacilliformis ATCC BAA-1200]|uniref:Sui1 family protein n=1 Tax=Neisseria bacilliformis ATCC BAA-1200 TaxID=888742 RepID=F2B9Z8_9NEIS|nr:Sui1 family protein [Neisseria bacilliformis ATCC BAA-1200]